ncbi:MAG: patatin-like phospholipase family protein [Lautropia sp.]
MAGIPTSLVLGSGGSRGLTHIGVIRCLQDRGYDIRAIAGSSIGALIGGIHATGKLDLYADWVGAMQRSDVLRLLDLSFGGDAIFKGERIMAAMRELIGEHDIESLPIGFTAVATDLSHASSNREVWFNRGPLFDAIRASIAVPTIFAPVRLGSRLLLDGGIVNPVPVGPTLNSLTDVTVAVDLNGRPEPIAARAADADRLPLSVASVYRERIGSFFERWWPGEGAGADASAAGSPATRAGAADAVTTGSADAGTPPVDAIPREAPGRAAPVRATAEKVGFTDIVLRSMEAMQASITQFRLAATTPAVLIHIPRNLCGFFDFHRARELIAFGYERTAIALDAYERDRRGIARGD